MSAEVHQRRIPIIPTIIVVAAAALMVALGFWQLGRLEEKEALIARYAANQQLPTVQLTDLRDADAALFRNVAISCPRPFKWESVAGRNSDDRPGYVHRFVCQQESMPPGNEGGTPRELYGVIGWSAYPRQVDWDGGDLEGVLAPLGDNFKLIAAVPQAGLEAVARPDPNDLPNNHLAYAGQWFFFALTALVIYILALRKRWR